MNPAHYCQEKGAPPGSSAYYALLQAPPARRALLTALFALRRELEQLVEGGADGSVTEAKFAWWRGEIEAFGAGRPTHPVTRALALPNGAAPLPPAALLALVDAHERDYRQGRYFDADGLRFHARHTGGAFAALVARESLPVAHADIDTDWASALGTALTLAGLLAHLGDHARHGRLYLPVDTMQRFGVTAADITERRYTPAFTQMMQAQTESVREALAASRAALPRALRRPQRTLLALAGLAEALLDEVQREDYAVLHQRLSLTPVRKLLIAWRRARFG